MYAWVWRRLPGPASVRVLQLLVLAAAIVAALFGVVFPWVDPKAPWQKTIAFPSRLSFILFSL